MILRRRGVQWLAFGLALVLAAGMFCGAAFGAKKKTISTVSLTIESKIKVGTTFDPDDIEVRSSSNKFSVDEVNVLNSGFEWSVEDIPKLEVVLQAEDNYYFSLSASGITLNGATYVTAVKRDASTKLAITMTLEPLKNQVAEIELVSFDNNGLATWDAVPGAASYEVKLFRDGKNIGGTKITANTYFQLYDSMTKPTTYSVKVRGVNGLDTNKKGRWVESSGVYIDPERTQMFAARKDAPAGQWNQSGDVWWYKNADGSYPANGWQEIGGRWYCFDGNGHMRTGWIDWNGKQYYCGDDGAMWFNTQAPDGRQLGGDGACL